MRRYFVVVHVLASLLALASTSSGVSVGRLHTPIPANNNNHPSAAVRARRAESGEELFCDQQEGSTLNVVAWSGTLQGCKDYAAKLNNAVGECPCGGKCSAGLSCNKLNGIYALTPLETDLPQCAYAALSIQVGVQEWTQQHEQIGAESCQGFVT
jgi:hypothetical protein